MARFRLNLKKAALIVAYPGNKTLWVGETIWSRPSWDWFIVSLSREGKGITHGIFYRPYSNLSPRE